MNGPKDLLRACPQGSTYPESIYFGLEVLYIGTLRPKYILFGYMDPWSAETIVAAVRFPSPEERRLICRSQAKAALRPM